MKSWDSRSEKPEKCAVQNDTKNSKCENIDRECKKRYDRFDDKIYKHQTGTDNEHDV